MARKDSIKNLKEVLIKRRDALRMALDGDLSMLRELANQSTGDVVDAALDSAQDEITSQLAEVESRELAHIEKALVRIEKGTYGKCEACQTNIPLARLQALPYARMCIQCQRDAEQNVGSGSNATDWGRLIDTNPGDDIRLSDIDINVP